MLEYTKWRTNWQ